MINVVAILAYLIIHINIPIFAVCSQIFIRLRLLAADSGLTQRNPLKCQSLVLADYLCRLPLYLPRQNSCWCDVTIVAGCCNTRVKLAQMKCFHIKNTSDSLLLGNINDGKKMIFAVLIFMAFKSFIISKFKSKREKSRKLNGQTDTDWSQETGGCSDSETRELNIIFLPLQPRQEQPEENCTDNFCSNQYQAETPISQERISRTSYKTWGTLLGQYQHTDCFQFESSHSTDDNKVNGAHSSKRVTVGHQQ